MYKEAYVMLKRAGWWDDVKSSVKQGWKDFNDYADQNQWVRPTVYGLGGAAVLGGAGAGLGALMGPQHRGRNVGIGLGSGSLLGALLGIGGGIAHNRHNQSIREQLKMQHRLHEDLKRSQAEMDAYKQKEQKTKADNQRRKKQQARQDAKNAAKDRMASDYYQGKLQATVDADGNIIPDSVNTDYYDYPDSSGDLQDAYMGKLRDATQQYKDAIVDDVFNNNTVLSHNTPQIQKSTRQALETAFRNAEAQLKSANMSQPAYLAALRERVQNRAKQLTAIKRFNFGLPEYVQ